MSFPFYTGNPDRRKTDGPTSLPVSRRAGQEDPRGYLPDQGLIDAVNVALVLGQPLLLTGEPGTGKTQLAYSVAWELGFGKPLKFETKTSSSSRDLFYTFDNIGRFRAAQSANDNTRVAEFISFNALGKAIVLANPVEHVQEFMPTGFVHPGQRRSVVLIYLPIFGSVTSLRQPCGWRSPRAAGCANPVPRPAPHCGARRTRPT